ncbi:MULTISPECIES: COG3650 family protein [Sphingobium]|uniref:COG3650 family protein n=1 Tax=Sphingobium sp. MI1205 TaxID=407020 RepID=UPI000770273B|nr:hypothetical protein [Sphingobium sp. MI1205]AMK16442.1 hypothetical protein K663_00240 [Sphingobium sp. MI1205]
MKSWLLISGMLILTGCGRKENMADLPRNDVPVANAPIENLSAAQEAPLFSDQREGAPPASTVVDTTPPSSETRYQALGTEPFWAVTVKGSTATLERPDNEPVDFAINRADDGRAVRYLGDGFSMVVTDGPCSDGMSDAHWADRVAVSFADGTLKGCGGVRADF